MKKIKGIGEISILLAALLWGCMSLCSRPLLNEMGFSSMQVTLFRGVLTVIVLSVLFLIKDKSLFRIKKSDIPSIISSGLFGFALFVIYLISINVNTVALGILLEYTSPIFVMIASRILLKEKITLQKVLTLIGAVIGMVMLVGSNGFGTVSVIGILVGLSAGVSYAGYNISNKFVVRQKINSLTAVFYTFLIVGVLCIPFSNVWELPTLIGKNPKSILYLLIVAIGFTALPYIFFNVSLENLPSSKVGVLSVFELVVGTIVGWLFFNESLNAIGIIGIIIVIISLVLLEINFKEKNKKQVDNQEIKG